MYEYATVSGSERWSSTASNGAEKSPVSKLKRLWSLPIVPAMKARYYPDTDSLYVEVRRRTPGSETLPPPTVAYKPPLTTTQRSLQARRKANSRRDFLCTPTHLARASGAGGVKLASRLHIVTARLDGLSRARPAPHLREHPVVSPLQSIIWALASVSFSATCHEVPAKCFLPNTAA